MTAKNKPFHPDLLLPTENGCHVWPGSKCKKGYGLRAYHGKTYRVHRVAWVHHFGEIPAGMHVCHRCDNPACANPEHLFLGTNEDNVRDKIRKGRGRRWRQTEPPVPVPDGYCTNGHPPSERGRRGRCLTCDAATSARYRQRKSTYDPGKPLEKRQGRRTGLGV